jgi:Ice-binding-like
MKKFTAQKAYLVVVVVLSFLMGLPGFASAALSPVYLGAAAPFGGFGGTAGVTNQGIFTVVNGDIGTTAISTAVTGFHDTGGNVYTETTLNIGAVNGTVFTATAPPGSVPGMVAAAAALAAQRAFDNLSPAALPGGIDVATLGGGAGALGGRTLAPGIYKSVPGSYSIQGGDLTLDAAGDPNAVWVFQMASTLTVGGPGAAFPQSVLLVNGAQAKNVFWQVGSAATINAAGGGTMAGTIIASSGTAFSTAGNVTVVTLNGRALVLNASLTMVNTVINVPAATARVGVFTAGQWFLDASGNGAWDGTPTDSLAFFGLGITGALPVAGDWSGSGITKIGIYDPASGTWYLDYDGNGLWDGVVVDRQFIFGAGVTGAIPVTGDWTGTGTTKIGIYVNGTWYLDLNGNGIWDGTPTDGFISFGGGVVGAVPVTGDWTGTGITRIGIYANGVWYLDLNGNGVWNGTPTDAQYSFGGGIANAVPVTGDWTGTGTTKIGIFTNGTWYFDSTGNGVWDGVSTDAQHFFGNGIAGAVPVTGKW